MQKWLNSFMISVLSIFMPIKAAMITVVVLIAADLITGIWGAIKKGDKITSAGIRRTVSKIIIYELALSLGFLIETYLISGLLPIVKMVGGMIGITEFKSITENLDIILGESVFDNIVKKLGSINDLESEIRRNDHRDGT